MKKVDLHIHTVSSILDFPFNFDLLKLQKYVEIMKLDIIAITNHNLFDYEQFKEIVEKLNIIVLPGIEISLNTGHLLLISDNCELEDFNVKCNDICSCI